MCGLFGWQLSPEAMKIGDVHTLAAILALHSEKRGDDSWGVAMRNHAQVPAISLLKNVGSIKKTCRIPQIVASQVLGHTRKATVGAVSLRNAHPFTYGKIVGAHNGWLYQHQELNKKYQRECQVDSEHVIAHIAEGREVSELDGIGTVTWIDMDNPDSILIGRSRQSDLCIMGIGPRSKPIGIAWCSISTWLNDALEMAGFAENFVWPTQTRTLYLIEEYMCYEEGVFDFATPQYGNTNQNWHGTRSYQHDTTGYRGSTQWDGYDREKGTQHNVTLIKKQSVSKSELEALPPHLKKNHEVDNLAAGEDTKVAPSDIQCMACGDWGRPVKSYEEDADGILHYSCIDEDLCCHCAAYWSERTGSSNIVVPSLKLVFPHKEKGGTNVPVAICHSAANVTDLNPDKE